VKNQKFHYLITIMGSHECRAVGRNKRSALRQMTVHTWYAISWYAQFVNRMRRGNSEKGKQYLSVSTHPTYAINPAQYASLLRPTELCFKNDGGNGFPEVNIFPNYWYYSLRFNNVQGKYGVSVSLDLRTAGLRCELERLMSGRLPGPKDFLNT
jgi:hypothetical protein